MERIKDYERRVSEDRGEKILKEGKQHWKGNGANMSIYERYKWKLTRGKDGEKYMLMISVSEMCKLSLVVYGEEERSWRYQ